MGLLNLAIGQLLGVFLPLAGVLVALYFYDRSRRRVTVSTLRFWPRRPAPPVRRRHKKIQHPFSLLLQLLAMLLLLLAIADPRPNGGASAARHHVLILDSSAAVAMPDAGGATIVGEAKQKALAYLNALPGGDQVLLVSAAGVSTVRVPFTDDRELVREAIRDTRPEYTALDLTAAFDLAAGALRIALDASNDQLSGRPEVGEVAYVGPGRVSADAVSTRGLPNVRFVATEEPEDSLGIRRISAVPDAIEPSKWGVAVEVDNFRAEAQTARLEFLFNGGQLGYRTLRVGARDSAELQFRIRTERAGRLTARLQDGDTFAPNNEAVIDLPAARQALVEVIGGSRRVLEPLLAAGPTVDARFLSNSSQATEEAIQVVMGSGSADAKRAIHFVPDRQSSPLRVAQQVSARRVTTWAADHPVARGVRDPDLRPSQAVVFEPGSGDKVVAAVDAGPVVIARQDGERRSVVFGFDPSDESIRNHLAVPLLFANAVAWLDPDAFQTGLIEARSPGAVAFDVSDASRQSIAIDGPGEEAVPWVLADGVARFYAGTQGSYRITTPGRQAAFHLSLPQVERVTWEPHEEVRRGVPSAAGFDAGGILLWPWLAAIGGLLLGLDWIWYGRGGGDSTFDQQPVAANGIGEASIAATSKEPVLEEVGR